MRAIEYLCRFLGHQRSRRQARMNANTGNWESKCARCGVPMVRVDHRAWIRADD